jgi:ribose transport system substrate-binding protein
MMQNSGLLLLARRTFGLTTATFALLAVVGIGRADAQCTERQIDLGDGKSVTGGCDPLRIAFLSAATNNVYLQSGIKGAQDAAAKHGATVDVFDGNWQPATQFNQAQNIISGGQYNAILAEMNDGNQACRILTEDAPKNNVLVSVANQPLCERADKEGEEYWAPGTLTYVGGSQGREAFRDFFMRIAEENPGPQKVIVVTGPDLNANTINTDAALKDVQEKYPDFKVVATVRTNYTVPQGNEKTLPLLQANPDATILIGNYSDITRGAVQAVKQAGLSDSIKVYDSGGNSWAFQAVRDGDVYLTRTYTPYDEMYKAVEALAKAWQGDQVPRYIPLESALVTKENIDQHQPQY